MAMLTQSAPAWRRALLQVVASPQKGKKKKKMLPTFGGGGEKCQACGKTAYQAERAQVDSCFFHVDCLRCAECGPSLRLGPEYGLAANAKGVICLYCATHLAEAKQQFWQPAGADEMAGPPPASPPVPPPALLQAHTAAEESAAIVTTDTTTTTMPHVVAVPAPAVAMPLGASPRASPPARTQTANAKPAGLGTAADRALEESLKRGVVPAAPTVLDTNPFVRCLQCL